MAVAWALPPAAAAAAQPHLQKQQPGLHLGPVLVLLWPMATTQQASGCLGLLRPGPTATAMLEALNMALQVSYLQQHCTAECVPPAPQAAFVHVCSLLTPALHRHAQHRDCCPPTRQQLCSSPCQQLQRDAQ